MISSDLAALPGNIATRTTVLNHHRRSIHTNLRCPTAGRMGRYFVEGWGWIRYRNATHPVFWVQDEDGYRTMLEGIDRPWDWPVAVAYLEAKAF